MPRFMPRGAESGPGRRAENDSLSPRLQSLRRVALVCGLVAVAGHAVEIAALDADEAGRPGAVGRMDAVLVVDHRHAGLQRVALDRLHQAGPVALGRLYLAPVGHLGGALGLAVDRPGAGVVVRLAALRVAVDVGHDAEAEVRVLVKQAPRRLVVLAQVVLDEGRVAQRALQVRSEEHTSELQSLMRISYAVFC